jgi:hypothetical protein
MHTFVLSIINISPITKDSRYIALTTNNKNAYDRKFHFLRNNNNTNGHDWEAMSINTEQHSSIK